MATVVRRMKVGKMDESSWYANLVRSTKGERGRGREKGKRSPPFATICSIVSQSP